MANGHFFFTWPGWKPDQDMGDGLTVTMRLTCAGTGPFSAHIVYHEAV